MAIIHALKRVKKHVKSITFDQGSEFADFKSICDCLGTEAYFCTPGSPEEKGGIENRNGVLRTVYPRNYEIGKVTQAELTNMSELINSRPMLCLHYRSPKIVYSKYISNLN